MTSENQTTFSEVLTIWCAKDKLRSILLLILCLYHRCARNIMSTLMSTLIIFLITMSIYTVQSIDLLPCTENIGNAGIQLELDLIKSFNVFTNWVDIANARIIDEATPPGYILDNVEPVVQTGRNPHRWRGIFRRRDVYSWILRL